MAQASSVAREPSMEEILASIRRIIEDSDVTRQVPADELAAEEAPVSDKKTDMRTDIRGEVAPFRRPNAEGSEAPASPLSRNYERPLLQEKAMMTPVTHSEPVRSSVISAVAAAIEKPEKPVPDTNTCLRASLENDDDQSEYVAVKPVPANDAPVAAMTLPETSVSFEQTTDTQDAAKTETKTGTADFNIRAKVEESVETDIQKIIAEMMENQPQETDVKPSEPLASVSTKQQVSASFSELSEAVRQERIRSLEEQAEALLRPMLQNWLDENLPSMVERLVREEIERMVHGDLH